MNDSITKLKQVANAEAKPSNPHSENKPGLKNPKKCSDACKIKSSAKKQYSMIQCSFCMVWLHEKCVGISEGDQIGLWFCPTCRSIPRAIKHDIGTLKTDVEQLKECTKSILSAVKGLSEKVENSFGSLNDRLTSLNRNINAKDLTLSESLESISSSTNSLKTVLDQKACQIINKTTTVLDKVKSQTEDIKTIAEKSKKLHVQPEVSDKSVIVNGAENNSISNTEKQTKKRQTKHISQKQQQQQKQKQSQLPESFDDTNTETIDLTQTNKTVIKQSVLLTGSSILKGVRNNGLKANVTVRTFPGATVESLARRLDHYNIDNCKTVILHVGGNDADDGVDLDTFCDNYTTLLSDLNSDDRTIIVSGLLPRGSVDLEPYNERLRTLCMENDIAFVDHFDGFLLASGELPATYYMKDKTHLSASGTRKLLQCIDKTFKITRSSEPQRTPSNPPRARYHKPAAGRRYRQHGQSFNTNYCHICSMNNHSTNNCWFNGRSNVISRHTTH